MNLSQARRSGCVVRGRNSTLDLWRSSPYPSLISFCFVYLLSVILRSVFAPAEAWAI
ncbi:uncharacterized protein PHACADRAFT_259025 [Phanerochaete carnosa HHB-10118-sp]|uniref:Uncharacterized protein n=1 Tax=Phanerochaete carnosa (strain HHB-10118-sp) TaxID=650164 RepID=K5WWP3_PHACS|nr:uncharacterized protein PHACADRAFT_259025 [Phanerochaete carnosa HHB-10118-sp]EKM54867.1 hypothetical protein PHACADRAFT_259025 [Phanerochaete carnosa HHB-10118-sp]